MEMKIQVPREVFLDNQGRLIQEWLDRFLEDVREEYPDAEIEMVPKGMHFTVIRDNGQRDISVENELYWYAAEVFFEVFEELYGSLKGSKEE
jgi:hypothetical protein